MKYERELHDLLARLVASKEIVKAAANNNPNCDVTVNGFDITLDLGVCEFVCMNQEDNSGALAVLRKLASKYSRIHNTRCSFPVPHPRRTSDNAYIMALPSEMWGEGKYANNRWDFVEWCAKELERGE